MAPIGIAPSDIVRPARGCGREGISISNPPTPIPETSSGVTSTPAAMRSRTQSKPFSFGLRAQPGAPRIGRPAAVAPISMAMLPQAAHRIGRGDWNSLRRDIVRVTLGSAALGALGLDASACLFVGDSFTDDVAGARRCGMKAAWINARGKPLPEGEVPPDLELRSFADLPAALGI